MDDVMDEFELYKAMAFNQNRRGSQSVPCTPQIPVKQSFRFTREASKSERRRRSSKRRNNGLYQSQNKSALLSDTDMQMCNSVSGEVDLTDRLSRLSMTEIWVRRLRMRRGSSSDHDEQNGGGNVDVNMLYPDVYGNNDYYGYPENDDQIYHEPLQVRRSNPEHSHSRIERFAKIDHRRSLSCRDRSRTNNLRNSETQEYIRPRTTSMPSKGNIKRPNTLAVKTEPDSTSPREICNSAVEFYLVRTFSTSKKGGLINRGDSVKRRKTPSTNAESDGTAGLSASSSGSVHSDVLCPPMYKVFMVGASGVGKTSLLQQFTSSDYMANINMDADTDDSSKECKMVSVLLDNEESSLYFVTQSDLQENGRVSVPDAYVIVYSVSDRDTLDFAVDTLRELHKSESGLVATILVANKGDMVRSRVIDEEEGKEIAVHFNCKYIEVSAIMNLRVDELLAGIVKQITLTELRRRIRNSKKRKHIRTSSHRDTNGCIEYAARGIVGRIFKRASPMFRSCDNLLVL